MEQAKTELLEKLKNRQTAPTLTHSMTDLVETKASIAAYMKMSFVEWRKELAYQCGVFVFGEHYIAKRFYQINYSFCGVDEAKEVVKDNLYALLRFKYFKILSDEIDDKISDIVRNFIMNLASTLIRISFDKEDDCTVVKHIPDYCVAFKNGVFDFKNNRWLFKYDIIKLEDLSNRIYMYSPDYIIQWYMNYDFEPIQDISIMETTLEEFVDMMTTIEEEVKYVGLNEEKYREKNICFELMYNMAHDADNKFDIKKFAHLCEVIGYMMNVSFLQYFILLIGAGRNGKNSLFDGCFSSRVIPLPTQNSMLTIETDRFITGTLENKFHNIYLETDEKSVSLGASTQLKQFTGSEQQTIEHKGNDRYSGQINIKYLFSANEQEKIKFGDLSDGFRRRINMFEVFYQFTPSVEKLKKKGKSYYYTPFKQDLSDIKNNKNNTTMFVYLAMYGIKCATKSFTRNFEFHKTDWNDSYNDIDLDIKEKVANISLHKMVSYMTASPIKWNECKKMIYDTGEMYDDRKQKPLYLSDTLKDLGYSLNQDSVYKMFKNDEDLFTYFANNDVYINLKDIQAISGDAIISSTQYFSNFKKMFAGSNVIKLNSNKPYVLVRFQNGKMKVLTNK